MSRRRYGDIADGDLCPLIPQHGKMFIVGPDDQFCAHISHSTNPPSRALWPLAGLVEAVAEHGRRLDTAGYNAGCNPGATNRLPDLSTLSIGGWSCHP